MPSDPQPCAYRYPDLTTNPPTAFWAPTYPPARRGSDRTVDFGYLSDTMADGVTQHDYAIRDQTDLWVISFDVLTDTDVDAMIAFFQAVGANAIYVKAPTLGGVFRKVKPIAGQDGRMLTFHRTGPETWSTMQRFRTSV